MNKNLNDHPIDALAKDLLGEASVEPREELWAAISAGVDPPAKRRGGFLPWMWVPAVAAVVGLLMLFTLKPQPVEVQPETAMNGSEEVEVVTPPVRDTDTALPAETLAEIEQEKEAEVASPSTPAFKSGADRGNEHPGRNRTPHNAVALTPQTPTTHTEVAEASEEDETLSPLIPEESIILPAVADLFNKTPNPAPNEEPKTSKFLREQMLQTPMAPQKQEEEALAFEKWNDGGKNGREGRNGGKWKLGGSIAPEYAFSGGVSSVPAAYPSAGAAPVNDDGTADLTPVTAFTTGLRTEYAVSDRVGLQSGLMYTLRRGNAGSVNSVNFINDSPVASEEATFYQTQYNFHFMEVPVAMKYNLLMRPKWNFFVSSGLSGNFFMSYRSVAESSEIGFSDTQTITNPFRPSQLDVLLGTGVEVQVSPRMFLNLEPGLSVAAVTSRYSFAASRPIALTFNTGLNFGL